MNLLFSSKNSYVSIKSLILILLFWNVIQVDSQNLIVGKWKFITGDSLAYAKPTFDDSKWSEIQAGEVWEKQGYDTYDGYAWYRYKTVIPSSIKKEAIKANGILIDLLKIDDADITYFNGEEIGKTGEFPPNYKGAYDVERKYIIPIDKIRWDKENTVAVRVYDGSGGGGIYGGKVFLGNIGFADNLKIIANYSQPDHVIRIGNSLELQVSVDNKYNIAYKGMLNIDITNDFGDKVSSQRKSLIVNRKSRKTDIVNVQGLAPGFYKAVLKFDANGDTLYSTSFFALQPEKVISPTDRQPDFDNYWARAKKELAAVDPQYKLIKIDSLSTDTRNVFILEMRSLGNVLIRGWYAEPVKAGKYPAILHVQGYSSNMKIDYAYQGDDFAVLALNIRGHGNSRDNVAPSFTQVPTFLQYQLADKEQYIYRGAYMDCTRAVDFLYSRNAVDTTKVVVEGGSQGGALSFATAALNNSRIRLCVPCIPFLSDFRNYFKVGYWPGNEFEEYILLHPEIKMEQIYKTLSYIDIKNLAPWIKAPVFMTIGLKDETCPPRINFAAYNNLTVPREYTVNAEYGHGTPANYNTIKYQWIKQQLGLIK